MRRLIDLDLLKKSISVDYMHNPTLRSEMNSNAYKKILDRIDSQPTLSEWIPCSERLPVSEEEVEVTVERRCHNATGEDEIYHFTCRAMYEDGTVTTEDSAYCWDNFNFEYDENKDTYTIPEGWWEVVSYSEEMGQIDDFVIAWMPRLKPYKESEVLE